MGLAYPRPQLQRAQWTTLNGVWRFRYASRLVAYLAELPEELRRRTRHVVTENARVLKAVNCASAQEFGALMNASHAVLAAYRQAGGEGRQLVPPES